MQQNVWKHDTMNLNPTMLPDNVKLKGAYVMSWFHPADGLRPRSAMDCAAFLRHFGILELLTTA